MRNKINDYIVADSEICYGKPTFQGTRIMVSIVLEMLRDGATMEEIIEAYPSLTKNHVKAALEFATNLTQQKFKSISS